MKNGTITPHFGIHSNDQERRASIVGDFLDPFVANTLERIAGGNIKAQENDVSVAIEGKPGLLRLFSCCNWCKCRNPAEREKLTRRALQVKRVIEIPCRN